jgi:hypothetical protein
LLGRFKLRGSVALIPNNYTNWIKREGKEKREREERGGRSFIRENLGKLNQVEKLILGSFFSPKKSQNISINLI